jgi:hypothetical protein
MGRLRDYVENLEVITPRGELARFNKGSGEFDSILEGTFGGAIKVITFSAVASGTVEMMCARFLYARALTVNATISAGPAGLEASTRLTHVSVSSLVGPSRYDFN